MINKLKIINFQLFKEIELNLQKINIITGINLDDLELSSNGSGKSTIINAIFFGLFGEVPGINLKDLIHLGEKECSVEIECSVNKEQLTIIRKVPSDLHVIVNNKELEGSTSTIKQKFITDLLCDSDFFRKFRTIDTIKGINILDLGTVSLRKILMTFIDTLFSNVRQNLLTQKLERERFNVDKRLYKFYLSDNKLQKLINGENHLKEEYTSSQDSCNEQTKVINNLKSEIQTKERMIYNRKKELEEVQKSGICPILKRKCAEITKSISPEQKEKINEEITIWEKEINERKEILINEQDYLNEINKNYNLISDKKQKTQSYIMKLKEAFKFKDYKYTSKDVNLYNESVKVLDSFAGWYINEWLSELSIIINDLLRKVNLEVTFSPDKDFIKIKNGTNELKFEQLSSGQKIFLNAIFKIAILLQKGETEGILVCDEGLSSLDKVNLNKFLEVCQELNYQILLIYQNIEIENKDLNIITIERKEGISNVKS
jgi:hypothetical protein